MRIICTNDANEGGVEVWSKIKVESLFTNYRIQSMADSHITMELSTDALLGALRSAASSASSSGGSSRVNSDSTTTDQVIIKLAKKNNQAVLAVEIHGTTRVGKPMLVAHDVKIELMSPYDAARLNEPLCPDPNIHILLPPLTKVRTVVERMKPMANVLTVRANNNGNFKLSINNDNVHVDTEWKGCIITRFPEATPSQASNVGNGANPIDHDGDANMREEPDPGHFFTVLVSIKSFLKFLNSHIVSSTTIAAICQSHCIILYVYIGDVADAGGVLTFYIPAIIDDD